MSPQEIVNLVQNLGVAVVAMGAMGWFVKYMFDKFTVMMETRDKSHKEEVDALKAALDNNTMALQKLIDKLETM